jgi:phenylpyruvate tautomerase PptA (4-oxalocrotonate tautomerase family)
MPMIDAFIPENALTPKAEQELLSAVADLVIKHEIGDPTNERARNSTWVSVHRPIVFVAGAPATAARYRFIVSVPEGQFDEDRRQAVTEEITEAVAKAEGGQLEEVKGRVWVITAEIPDGSWGARGRVVRLPEILAAFFGERGREVAMERLAKRKGW